MYEIHVNRIRSHVRAAGGEIVAMDRDHSAPPEWVSHRYYVRRKSGS